MFKRDYLKKPEWLKVKIPSGDEYRDVYQLLKKYHLTTVCQEARCPNIHECWNKKSATIMILGDTCTRACRFCSVTTGNPRGHTDTQEPEHVAEVIQKLGLQYVVITSVDRDDLPDYGSSHYANTIKSIKEKNLQTKVEALIPDFNGKKDYLKKVVDANPFIIGHNVETVKKLTPFIRDHRCSYEKSLSVLEKIKTLHKGIYTKSGFMLGLGEEQNEILQALKDLKDVGVDIVTIGQYLQPTRRNVFVQKYYTPEEFSEFKKIGEDVGIKHMICGPLVRSSYHAAETAALCSEKII
ncbi:lipoyl synthase [candidate division TA06 bacterium DG_78]|uniref:Lipoyl synthase n=1 Tax=candidate division TA06 bacterium DG_78 TaxID=1703772 RepID=A0A0S7YCC6_UNCT6|nr:MAG: lipoyl synthase [candidate division TA06 bacterium DG_78]